MANIPLPDLAASLALFLGQVSREPPETVSLPLVALPDIYQDLSRPVFLSGSFSALPEAPDWFQILTSGGPITLDAKTFLATRSGWTAEDFWSFLTTNKAPLSLTIPAGSPPRLAFLELPPLKGWVQQSLQKTESPPALSPLTPAAPVGEAAKGEAAKGEAVALKVGSLLDCVALPEIFGKALDVGAVPLGAVGAKDFALTLEKHPLRSTSLAPSSADSLDSATAPNSAPCDAPQKLEARQFRVRAILDPAPSVLESAAAGTASEGPSLAAEVTGRTAQGRLLLAVGDQTYLVQTSVVAQRGAKILVEDYPLRVFPRAKDEDSDLLFETDVSGAMTAQAIPDAFLNAAFPKTQGALPTSLLLFFHALGKGDLGAWVENSLSEKIPLAKRKALGSALREAVEKSLGLAQDREVGTWQRVVFPVHEGQILHMLPLFVHRETMRDVNRDGSANQQGRKDQKTRFIVNISLSRLGAIQVDGLSQSKKLDLIVRSQRPLPSGLPENLRATYVRTLEALGLCGGLSFQTGSQNWITPHEATARADIRS